MAPAFTDRKREYGGRLRQARLAAGMTQESAAAAVGTSRRHWIRWESGETSPNPVYRERIADKLNDPALNASDDDEEAAAQMPIHRDVMEALHYSLGLALGKVRA